MYNYIYNINLTIPAYWFNIGNKSKSQFKKLVCETLDLDKLLDNVKLYLDTINQNNLPDFKAYKKTYEAETIMTAFYLFDYKQYLIRNNEWNYQTKGEENKYFTTLLKLSISTIKERMNEIIYPYSDCRYKDILKI